MKKLYSIEEAENFKIDDIWALYRKYVNNSQVDLISSFGFGNDKVKKAEVIYIYTTDGKKIYDFTGGVGVLNHGHNHPRILRARKKFSESKKMEVHKNYFSPYIAALSCNIANLLPSDLNISYFPNSGAEAVEGAIKMAYKYHDGKRGVILHSDISFHGKTIGASNITSSVETAYYKFQKVLNTDSFKFNDIESVKEKINLHKKNNKSDIYAIITETFSASSINKCSEKFLRELRKICDQENIILIFDEIYSGWCKTGKLFYFMNYENLIPDILTSAKSLGGGKASIACYTCRDHIFKKAYDNQKDATLHSTTFNGFGEETITAIEAINIIVEEDFEKKSIQIGENICQSLNNLKKKHNNIISEVRGSGCLNGIVINTSFADKYLKPILNIIPIEFLKDETSVKKIIVASIIFDLYRSYNILTFYGSNKDIPLKVAPSILAKKEDIDYFENSLDQVLNKGLMKLVSNFVSQKFFSKFK
jgi:putrescine aminotransferase